MPFDEDEKAEESFQSKLSANILAGKITFCNEVIIYKVPFKCIFYKMECGYLIII